MINSQINASNLDETFQRFEINISRFSVEKEKRATADKRERERDSRGTKSSTGSSARIQFHCVLV